MNKISIKSQINYSVYREYLQRIYNNRAIIIKINFLP